MRATRRPAAGLLACVAIVASAGTMAGAAPSRAAGAPSLPALELVSLLPSLPLGTPLPSLDLGTPLPSLPLGTPLPSLDLGTPLPSLDLGTPLPSLDLATPSPSAPPLAGSSEPGGEGSASPSATAEPGSNSVPSEDGAEGSVGRPEEAEPPSSRGGSASTGPRIADLLPVPPVIPDVGTWLVPTIGMAVPLVVAAAFALAQLIGGAAGVALGRRVLDRVASLAPDPSAHPRP